MASNDLWKDEDDEEVKLSSRYLKRLAPDIKTKKDLEKRQKFDGFNNELRQRYAERAGIVSKPQWLQKFEGKYYFELLFTTNFRRERSKG